jgi:hypothetical protein
MYDSVPRSKTVSSPGGEYPPQPRPPLPFPSKLTLHLRRHGHCCLANPRTFQLDTPSTFTQRARFVRSLHSMSSDESMLSVDSSASGEDFVVVESDFVAGGCASVTVHPRHKAGETLRRTETIVITKPLLESLFTLTITNAAHSLVSAVSGCLRCVANMHNSIDVLQGELVSLIDRGFPDLTVICRAFLRLH